MTTVRFLCALAVHFGWDVHQSDIVTAFLNGDIFEEVYVTQPRGFVKKGQEDKVRKCHKALYGLKQSPRAWYEKADTHLVKRGFRNSPIESTLYTNLIKESIRMGHNDLGDFHYGRGDLQLAFKCFVRTRDYCTTSKHIISMCLNVILVAVNLGQFHHVSTYVAKAEQTPDNQEPQVVAKLRVAAGLAFLENQKYKHAARKFVETSSDLGVSYTEVIAPQDVATYGGLCALASFDRAELKSKVIDNINFKNFLELVPEVRELIQDFYARQRPTGTMVRALRDSMGDLHTCPDEILEMASVYYETLFTSDLLTGDVLDARDEVWSFVRPMVSGDMQTAIMRPFSLQEVIDAVHGLDGASCPGDDGLIRQFFMQYWDLIAQPLQEGLQEIFDTGVMPQSIHCDVGIIGNNAQLIARSFGQDSNEQTMPQTIPMPMSNAGCFGGGSVFQAMIRPSPALHGFMPDNTYGAMQAGSSIPMYGNIGVQPGFQCAAGSYGMPGANMGMAGFSQPDAQNLNMASRSSGNFGSGMPLLNALAYDNLTPKGKPKDYKRDKQSSLTPSMEHMTN
ncbi:hypothetical protein L7F22_030127 [Adiantum nelumboides]|nr:hypothetical protein [Adiantum nelumboides]